MEAYKDMKSINQRPFSILADCDKIYQFLLEIYERDWRNGVPAPFFEYAYVSFSYWMDISYSYKNRIWECDGEIVAFCFYENPVTDIYFCLKNADERKKHTIYFLWRARCIDGCCAAVGIWTEIRTLGNAI